MSNEDFEKDFDLKTELNKYTIHWKWFAICMAIALFGAFLMLRYTVPQYKASTKILIKDNSKGGGLAEMAAFSDLGVNSGAKNIENEIEVLKSRTSIESTIKKLNLNISLISKGQVLDTEVNYPSPIQINFLNKSSEFYEKFITFEYAELASGRFLLSGNLVIDERAINEFKFGEIIETKFGNIIITKANLTEGPISREFTIEVSPLENVIQSYKQRLEIAALTSGSSVLVLSLTDPVLKKAELFLNTLVETYNENAVYDKNFISKNTYDFITNRLLLVNKELDGVEHDVANFKISNKVINLETQSGMAVSGAEEYNKKAVETEMQMSVLSSMIDYLKKSSSSDLLPSNLFSGLGEGSTMISSYNQLILDRNRILKSATIENPTVVKLDQQILSLKESIMASLRGVQSTLKIQKKDLNLNEGVFNSKMSQIPIKELEFRAIARQQNVKEGLYLYLLQKREETAITLSSTEPNVKVIDVALGSKSPIGANKNVMYLGALALGILIPLGIIFLLDFLDTKIKSRLDLEGKTVIPFIGDVPTSDTPSEIIQTESRTSSAEAMRIVRTNLEFMLTTVPEGVAKTIFLTSTFPKEGKTFVSANLAATFALSGKKVLIIGMDVRNPRLDEYLNIPERGLTNYLSSKDLQLEDLIVKYPGYEDFHVLPAGVIPPNPAELLMSKKVDTLFSELKSQYDYIIVDTAPVSLVTDTLLIAKHADCFIYVARAGFLEKRLLKIANELYKEGKLPNMCLLLNDTDSTKGYGYGYGYGLKVKNEPWYKKIVKS